MRETNSAFEFHDCIHNEKVVELLKKTPESS